MGSILQMRRSRRSLRFIQPGSVGDSGTLQSWPSGGRQSRTPFAKERYWTSYSRSRASVSASLVSRSPRDLTKWPTGYLESRSHASIVTKIRFPDRSSPCRVRSLIFGMRLSIGFRKTVCCFRPLLLPAPDVASTWPTYCRQLRFVIPTTRAVG